MNHYSYRLSFIFAITLHAVVVFFLLAKFSYNSRSIALKPGNTFINATTVNERDIDNQKLRVLFNQAKEIPKTISSQPVVKKPIEISDKKLQTKEQLRKTLQKSLLLEQAKEIAELKKEKQAYQKNIAIKQQQQQMQKILQDQILAEQQQLAGEQSQAHGRQSQGEVDKYKAKIIQAISLQWIYPEEVDEKASCQLLINIAPGGVVLDVQLISSSGNSILDRSAQAAVLKASPLPVPEDNDLFDDFRTIKFRFNPRGIVGN